MKTTKELTKEELMAMPLIALRRLDIDTPAQQLLVQEIVNLKLATLPPQRPVFRRDIPDIQTPQEEERWQTIINQREAKIRNTTITNGSMEETAPETTPEVVPTIPEVAPVIPDVTPDVTPTPSSPDEAGMAQPSGEGEPVNLTIGVSPKLGRKKSKVK